MKLYSQTGSLTNHILSRAVIGQPEPVEGMGATILAWTDRHAATIVEVSKRPKATYVYVREDKAIVVSGSTHDGSAQYRYESNPNGHMHIFRSSKGGMWDEVIVNDKTGRFNKIEGQGLRIGERVEYRDPSF